MAIQPCFCFGSTSQSTSCFTHYGHTALFLLRQYFSVHQLLHTLWPYSLVSASAVLLSPPAASHIMAIQPCFCFGSTSQSTSCFTHYGHTALFLLRQYFSVHQLLHTLWPYSLVSASAVLLSPPAASHIMTIQPCFCFGSTSQSTSCFTHYGHTALFLLRQYFSVHQLLHTLWPYSLVSASAVLLSPPAASHIMAIQPCFCFGSTSQSTSCFTHYGHTFLFLLRQYFSVHQLLHTLWPYSLVSASAVLLSPPAASHIMAIQPCFCFGSTSQSTSCFTHYGHTFLFLLRQYFSVHQLLHTLWPYIFVSASAVLLSPPAASHIMAIQPCFCFGSTSQSTSCFTHYGHTALFLLWQYFSVHQLLHTLCSSQYYIDQKSPQGVDDAIVVAARQICNAAFDAWTIATTPVKYGGLTSTATSKDLVDLTLSS